MHRPLYDQLVPYYELIEGRDWTREVKLLRSILSEEGASSVVDLGCGTGYHVRALTSYGLSVLGVDISLTNIRYARKLAKREGVDCRFVAGSYYRYRPQGAVDAALCLNWSIPTRDFEISRFLRNTRSILRIGGILIMDYERSSEIVWKDVGKAIVNSWSLKELVIARVSVGEMIANVLYSRDIYILYRKSKATIKTIPRELSRYRATRNTSLADVYKDCSYVRFFSMTELRRFANRAGFRVIANHVLPRNGYRRNYAVLKRIL